MKDTWGGTFESKPSEPTRVSVESLLREFGDGPTAGGRSTETTLERLRASALSSVTHDVDGFRFDEDIVKHSLDELLLVLIGLHGDGTHGKQLMDDLSRLFDARLSPGTVYPRLHEMEDSGTVNVHEMVRTKEYTIEDEAGTRERVREAMNQHLAVGLFLQRALEDGDPF